MTYIFIAASALPIFFASAGAQTPQIPSAIREKPRKNE
jgi:hypothetical protein